MDLAHLARPLTLPRSEARPLPRKWPRIARFIFVAGLSAVLWMALFEFVIR